MSVPFSSVLGLTHWKTSNISLEISIVKPFYIFKHNILICGWPQRSRGWWQISVPLTVSENYSTATGERKDGQVLIHLKIFLTVVTLLMFLFRLLFCASSSFHPEITPWTPLVCLLSPPQDRGSVIFVGCVLIFLFCFIIQSEWLCEKLWPGGS